MWVQKLVPLSMVRKLLSECISKIDIGSVRQQLIKPISNWQLLYVMMERTMILTQNTNSFLWHAHAKI